MKSHYLFIVCRVNIIYEAFEREIRSETTILHTISSQSTKMMIIATFFFFFSLPFFYLSATHQKLYIDEIYREIRLKQYNNKTHCRHHRRQLRIFFSRFQERESEKCNKKYNNRNFFLMFFFFFYIKKILDKIFVVVVFYFYLNIKKNA